MILDGYVRVSRVGDRDGESFISPAVQRERIGHWAAAHGHTIGAWHEELDESGGRDDRPLFLEALARCEAGATGGIIVAKLDRFARSVAGAAVAIKRLEACGAELVSVQESLDTSTPFGRFARTVMLAMAELELDRIAESWLAARRHAVGRGVHVGPLPAGYARPARGAPLEPHPQHAAAVRRAFQMRAGGEGPAVIARYLTRAGVPSYRRASVWQAESVSKLLANRVYLGEARSGAFVNRDAHPAIVDRATFEAAQAARTVSSWARRDEPAGLLAGLARCAGCRYVLRVTPPKTEGGETRYRCSRRHAHGECSAPASVWGSVLEPFVEELVARALELERWEYVAEPAGDGEVDDATRALEAAEAELRAYRDTPGIAVALGDAFVEGLLVRRRAVDDAARALAGLRRPELEPPGDAKGAAELLGSAAPDRRRALMFAALDAVFVRQGPTGSGGDPAEGRVFGYLRGELPDGLELPRRGVAASLEPVDWPEP
jgi:DNA invertase Pin-like site-specific DNA recombinase